MTVVEDFNDLNAALRHAPVTWIPGLLDTLVRHAVQKNVWKEDGLTKFVANSRQRTVRQEANPDG